MMVSMAKIFCRHHHAYNLSKFCLSNFSTCAISQSVKILHHTVVVAFLESHINTTVGKEYIQHCTYLRSQWYVCMYVGIM